MAGIAERAMFGDRLVGLGIPVRDDGVCGCGRRAEQAAAPRQFLVTRPVRQKPELPDAHESAGQDVQEKTPDELDGVDRHGSDFVAARVVFPLKSHASVLRIADQNLRRLMRTARYQAIATFRIRTATRIQVNRR